jgi:hypothetical protein
MPIYIPAMTASGESTSITYYNDDGTVRGEPRTEAKPIIEVYVDEIADTGGALDVFAAVSRDDGNTWQRNNISRHGGLSSFRLKDGTDFPSIVVKPSLHVKGNKIMIVWTSTYARGGSPRYAITDATDPNYTLDVWGVGGSQRSVDYTDQGFPDVGELPFTVVWACRGTIDVDASDDGQEGETSVIGDVTWFQPERITSGTRNAMQLVAASGGSDGKYPGFAIAWQEDPDGIRTGSGEGPGLGWSGAIAHHGTDLWYSWLRYDDHDKIAVDEDATDSDGRPKAAVLLSLPVRITDNEMVNTDNVDSHLYVWGPDGIENTTDDLVRPRSEWPTITTEEGASLTIAVTNEDKLLDGDTGSTRPALFLQPYDKKLSDGTTLLSAWAVIATEESKGLGGGAPEAPNPLPGEEDEKPDEGRYIMYHTFDFMTPDLVKAGYLMNPPSIDPETYETYNVTDENGQEVLDWEGEPILNYENARRPRLLIQGKSAAIAGKPSGTRGTVMILIFKQSETTQGGPSDIFIRRWETSSTDTGNPYKVANLVPLSLIDEGQETVHYDPAGLTNISSVTSLTAQDDGKMLTWEQTEENLDDLSWTLPTDNAQGHRGWIRGDQVVLAYDWTPDWQAATVGGGIYNLYVRRSFDGAKSFTTAPATAPYYGDGVTFKEVFARDGSEIWYDLGAGEFEPARNITLRTDTKVNIIEPRTVPLPGTIKRPDGTATGYPEDVLDRSKIWLFWGTGAVYSGDEDEDFGKVPLDLEYTYSSDYGDSWMYEEKTIAGKGKKDPSITYLVPLTLASGPTMQGEAQPKFSPSGEICYVSWNDEGPAEVGAEDVYFGRIAPDVLSSYSTTGE